MVNSNKRLTKGGEGEGISRGKKKLVEQCFLCPVYKKFFPVGGLGRVDGRDATPDDVYQACLKCYECCRGDLETDPDYEDYMCSYFHSALGWYTTEEEIFEIQKEFGN